MILLLLAFTVLIPWFLLPLSDELRQLRRLEELLFTVEMAARAGRMDPWRTVSVDVTTSWTVLEPVMLQARRSGWSITEGVSALRRQVARGVRRAEQRAQLIQLVRTRLSFAVSLAAAGRLLLVQATVWGPLAADVYCVLAAAIACGVATCWLGRCLPRVWLHSEPEEVAAWLESYMSGMPKSVACDELSALSRQELCEGLDLQKEKRRTLVAWAQRRAEAERQLIRRFVESLPLVEVLGFGLIASLILAGPALSAWYWTEPEGPVNAAEISRGSP